MRAPSAAARPLRLLLAALTAGCAPAAPSLAGGRTVPVGRSDLALGAAVRVPTGALVPDGAESLVLALDAPGGAAPLAFVRHGITDDVDLGLEVIGSTLRGSVRGQVPLGSGFELVLGAQPHAVLAHDGQATAGGGGVLLPAVVALELTSLYEIWFGLRAGLEHLAGDLDGRSTALSGLRTGAVAGLGVGFRRLHVLVELGVDHEYWWGRAGDRAVAYRGFALTPAFALRLRL